MSEDRRALEAAHKEKDDAVFKFLRQATEDIYTVFAINNVEEKRNYTSERVQLICVFTVIDVFASYWYEYQGKTGTQSGRFLDWTKTYCFTERNPDWKGDFAKITPEQFYAFRCSMVHFLGISDGGGHSITVATNRVEDALIEKWRQGFQKRGISVLFFKPKIVYNFILEGVMLMFADWKEVISQSNTDEEKKGQHIDGIGRIYRKIQSEGATKVVAENQSVVV